MLTHRYAHMVQEYHVRKLREIMAARRDRLAALKTRGDAEKYVARVRKAVRAAFGPFPKRTPLNAKIAGRNVCPGYVVEKVLFESRPGFHVTANLYLPDGVSAKRKAPCVLGLCGHSLKGKAEGAYQAFALGLVSKGFMVLVIDPISQGERWQHNPPAEPPELGLCHAHNLMGNQMVLTGDFFGSWRAWDAIRGLDYLLSRPEADRTRVGVTGNSGGGTLTSYVAALDPRPTMVAPSCYIASWPANMENELPADAEQNPPGILAAGLDEVDLLLCYAPRPTIILTQYNDFFDERAGRQAFDEARKVHRLLGSPRSMAYFQGPGNHGYSKENREAMLAFFMKKAGLRGSLREPEFQEAAEATLWATPTGDVRKLNGEKRAFEIHRERAAELAAKRPFLTENATPKIVRETLGLPARRLPPARYRFLCGYHNFAPELQGRGQYAIETEPGIQAILAHYGPIYPVYHLPKGALRLFVGHLDSQADVKAFAWLREMALDDKPFLALDPRGTGQSLPKCCGAAEFLTPYAADYLYAAAGEMLGENYFGRRVFDVLRTMGTLYREGAEKIELIGRGLGAPVCVFAAALCPRRPNVRIRDYLRSYREIVDAETYDWPLSCFPRGVLRRFDLPDLYRVLGDRLTAEAPAVSARAIPLTEA